MHRTGILALTLMTVACSGGGSSGGGGSVNFVMATNQSSVVTASGGSGSVAFQITPDSGFDEQITLAVDSAPTGINASISPTTLTSGTATLSYSVDAGVAAGSYDIVVTARSGSGSTSQAITVHTTPVGSSAGLTVIAPAEMSVRPGGSTATLIELTRTTSAKGDVTLNVSGLPAGATASFDQNPTAQDTALLMISADVSTATGVYPVAIGGAVGSDTGTGYILLEIVATDAAQDTWINRVELAQSYFSSDLVLVSGKDVMVRAHVLTDGSAVASPVVRVTALNGATTLGTRDLTGPTLVPTSESPSSLGMSFSSEIPAAWISSGLQLRVDIDPDDLVAADRDPTNDTTTITPQMVTGPALDLVVVPLIVNGRTPTPANYHDEMFKHWPLRAVNITTRAAYTVTSVTDVSSDGTGWSSVLSELASLRTSDGSSAYYYGALDVSYGSGVYGLGYVGFPASIGVDTSVPTMLHELGHNFGLSHAPCGGAASADPDYPHTTGICGTWGYDLLTNTLKSPTATNDLMGYCGSRWISGFFYEKVRVALAGSPMVMPLITGGSSPEPLVTVSGWVADDGTVTLDDVRHSHAVRPAIAAMGSHTVRLTFGGVTTSYAACPCAVGCGPTDPRGKFFTLTVPDSGGLDRVEVLEGTRRLVDVKQPRSAKDPGITWVENAGSLQVNWDHVAYPKLAVVHVGAQRTTLTLKAAGGTATVSTQGLPAGGSFEFAVSNGIDGRCVTVAR